MINKEKILNESRGRLSLVIERVKVEGVAVRNNILKLSSRIKNFASVDDKVEVVILANNKEREVQLEQTAGSPYFVRCDLRLCGEEEVKAFYFGKFQLSEANIFSWVSPIAQVRFDDIGATSYKLPGEGVRNVELLRKDQFMIVDGQIKFLASESVDYERTLVYQDHLSDAKRKFVLPEIISKMEKAQDQVIRAEHKGSFLIAGPAGSGKTTLAFHRIAYLAQSPDTAKSYPGWNVIVFVQDESTKEYFSAILPQLGIEDVRVTTFERWALEVLNLSDYKLASRIGRTNTERDLYEFHKNQALKSRRSGRMANKNIEAVLMYQYRNIPSEYQDVLKRQLAERTLDRFDLTILLKSFAESDGGISIVRRVVAEVKNGEMKMVEKKIMLSYAFIVIDETENYLAEQIGLIKSCANQNKSVLYVGDLAQQTRLCTIKNWNEVDEEFSAGRHVLLDKVYRNTREILEYIASLGYKVSIPKDLRSGRPVIENECGSSQAARDYILRLANDNPGQIIGVLYEEECVSEVAKLNLASSDSLNLLTFNEAQGVEFEIVVILDYDRPTSNDSGWTESFRLEKEKVERDLRYVALTRSMNQLHILKI